jgi:hypothetical protein
MCKSNFATRLVQGRYREVQSADQTVRTARRGTRDFAFADAKYVFERQVLGELSGVRQALTRPLTHELHAYILRIALSGRANQRLEEEMKGEEAAVDGHRVIVPCSQSRLYFRLSGCCRLLRTHRTVG